MCDTLSLSPSPSLCVSIKTMARVIKAQKRLLVSYFTATPNTRSHRVTLLSLVTPTCLTHWPKRKSNFHQTFSPNCFSSLSLSLSLCGRLDRFFDWISSSGPRFKATHNLQNHSHGLCRWSVLGQHEVSVTRRETFILLSFHSPRGLKLHNALTKGGGRMAIFVPHKLHLKILPG